MAGFYVTQAQLEAFSDSLHRIYGEPTGENPVNAVLDGVEEMMRISSFAVDRFKAEGARMVAHEHLTSRGFEGHPEVAVIPRLVVKDHPMIQHAMRTRRQDPLRMSDFVTQRQLKGLSIYDFNRRVHEWRDQISLPVLVTEGTVSITLNRDREFSDEEFLLLNLFLPHVKRVLNRCALFKRLPGNEQLTAREREVLYWITQGKRDEEIACIVQAKTRTINKHVCSIFAKLGVENRTAAVTMVLAGQPEKQGNGS